jgi:hypothetical protein
MFLFVCCFFWFGLVWFDVLIFCLCYVVLYFMHTDVPRKLPNTSVADRIMIMMVVDTNNITMNDQNIEFFFKTNIHLKSPLIKYRGHYQHAICSTPLTFSSENKLSFG